jgi:hypothetical protein
VMLYDRAMSTDEHRDPDGILRGALYPHGLRFTADDQFLFVADGGRPYIHVYERGHQSWRGVKRPIASVRVKDDDLFLRWLLPRHGGPKGLDLDRNGRVLALTSEGQPLIFCDVARLLDFAAQRCPDPSVEMGYELHVLDELLAADARIEALDWAQNIRIAMTKRLRRTYAAWRDRRRR